MVSHQPRLADLPDGIFSLLDTDLYKLTMQCAILKYLPAVQVTYAFTNRTPHMRLNREAFEWLQGQVQKLDNIAVTAEEIEYLKSICPYLNTSYLQYLQSFRLQSSRHVELRLEPVKEGQAQDRGQLHMTVKGLWLDTILYEIPLLALTSEAYFKFSDKDWDHQGQEEKAYDKGLTLLEHGCIFSEFGTRRRRDYHTHDLVMKGLKRASEDAQKRGLTGKLSGTSNVHFGMKYGLSPVGTVAHEWFMGIASITDDYEHANETALRYWIGCFGEGVLGIALTDTFGTPSFLKAFKRTMPTPAQAERDAVQTQLPTPEESPERSPPTTNGLPPGADTRSYAQIFTGVRQDSGDPKEFITSMRKFYDSEDVKGKKTIVFSDSLNIDLCIEYKQAAEAAGFLPTFGVGTFFTNDFTHVSNGQKSVPMNIVIKLSSAGGRPAIKISDNIGKNTGDSETVQKVKGALGYIEKDWEEGDENTRWGG